PPPPPDAPPFPYTTLFRSALSASDERAHRGRMESHRERQQPHRNPRALSAPAIHPLALRRGRLPAAALVTQPPRAVDAREHRLADRKSTRLNSSHQIISYA